MKAQFSLRLLSLTATCSSVPPEISTASANNNFFAIRAAQIKPSADKTKIPFLKSCIINVYQVKLVFLLNVIQLKVSMGNARS
jgi:hypothetical protein